jgi:enamine deaminase RidA (YjgF/YER057c/UK114 family)
MLAPHGHDRTTVGVTGLALGAAVEIDLIVRGR